MKYIRYLPFILIPVFTLLTFWGLWGVYFQQDEWNGFGKVIYAQEFGYQTLVRVYGSHFTPFSSLFFAFLYNTFSLNHFGYAWFSILTHMVNGILLYFLALRFIKHRSFALIAAFLFLSARVSSQAVSWFAASPAFLPSGFFVLIGMLFFEEYIVKKRSIYLIGAVVSTLASLLFRENGIFLFAYFCIRVFLVDRKLLKKTLIISSIFTLSFLLFRFVPTLLKDSTGIAHKSARALVITDVLKQGTEFFFMSPPQLLFPRSVAFQLGLSLFSGEQDFYTFLPEETYIPIFIEGAFFKVIYSSLWFMCALFLFVFLARSLRQRDQKQTILSLIAYIMLSVLPFAVFPRNLFMESRHFYLSEIGFALVLGYISYIVVISSKKIHTIIGCLSVIFLFILFNAYQVNQRIKTFIETSNERISFVEQFPLVFPSFPEKVLFLRMGYPTPFQSGVGYLLMVLFHQQQKYHVFLKEDFLWNLGSQGYREVDNVGFGYYRELSELLSTYCEKKFKPENVFGFEWDKAQKRILDHSEKVREKLICLD